MVKSDSETYVRAGKSKIGILGGSFDPVHIGHLVLAEYAIEKFDLEKIVFIPNNMPPHKEKPIASPSHRYNMVKLALMDNPKFEALNIEIKRGGISYSYQTLLALRKKEPDCLFYFLLGSDAYMELKTWKNFHKLIKLTNFIVATRPGVRIKKLPYVTIEKLLMPEIALSSSYIRQRVKSNLSIRYLVPERVRDYIITYHLYK